MRKRASPKTETEESESPGPFGGKITTRKAQSGIVQFSTFQIEQTDTENRKIILEDRVGLDWQAYSELQEDHGQSLICGALHPLGLYILSAQKKSKLLADIKSKISKIGWDRLESYLMKLRSEGQEEPSIDAFIVAAWVQLFEESFQMVWLAAMAKHACYIQQDGFAFGYLTALLDQKKNSEEHFLRGRETLKSAGLGGKAKASATRPETQRTLLELSRLVSTGHTVARASDLAFRNGFGASASANKKLWNRNRKK